MSIKHFVTTMCILLISMSISAEVPNTMNYQGRLTDAVGDPVADAAYLVKFTIYDASAGGADLWNSGFQPVSTVGGLFNYEIGSNISLPLDIFDDTARYLGITVGADLELTPRSKLNTVPYAKTIDGSRYVNVTGDIMTGDLTFQSGSDTRIFLDPSASSSALQLFGSNNLLNAYLIAGAYGELALYDENGLWATSIGAGHSSTGGFVYLYDPIGANGIFLNAGNSGNSTVILPDDAIDNTEIIDEPGIASTIPNSNVSLGTSMSDLATVSITIPAEGYINVTAKCWATSSGNSSTIYGIYQIDQTSGGSWDTPHHTLAGANNALNSSLSLTNSVYVDRVYFKSAGTHTFIFEGMKYPSGTISTGNHVITAVYYPTSYGTVNTISSQPPTDTDAEMVTVQNLDGSTSTGYKYDLRDLELKAKASALKAKEDQIELMKAQHQQNSNQD